MPLHMLLTAPANDPPSWLPVMLMTAGLVMLGVILTASVRRKIANRDLDQPDPRQRIAEIKRDRAGRDDLTAAEARLLDTTRRLAAQLDNKAQRLEQLLAEADATIAALREAKSSPRIDPVKPQASPSPAPAPARAPARAPTPTPALDPLTRSVYGLADDGLAATAIAQKLDEPIGKVELILALRQSSA